MPVIRLITHINVPFKRYFDLSKSIDLHLITTQQTHEKALEDSMTGLVERGGLYLGGKPPGL